MLIEEKFCVKAPIQKVWGFLLNHESIRPCIPGCEKIERINENEFISTVKIKVGPIAVGFRFKRTIEEIPLAPIFGLVGKMMN